LSKQPTASGGPPADRPCSHHGPAGHCGATPARLYLPGWRCAAHTPAALAGRPEPGATRYCPPAACNCGQCPQRHGAGRVDRARRVLVTGSRTWTDHAVIRAALAEHFAPGVVLVSGACPRGADAIAEHIWSGLGGHVERHPADWAAGRGAGYARNTAMVATGADVCLAFIRDHSPGATHAADTAARAGIPVHRHDHNPEEAPPGLIIERAGRAYIRRGWPVFVLGRSKRPVANCRACKTAGPGHDPAACDCLTCHGFYAATLDPARLGAMLGAVPGGLLAIRTGTASGLLVVDIDPRNGGAVDTALMPPTATVATGGGGWHLYYRHPGGPVAAALAGHPGVDLKGEGGYVTAPPSIHPDTRRPYRWARREDPAEMPPALAAAVAPPRPAVPPASTPAPRPAGGAGISSPAALLGSLLAAVERAPEGRRRNTLYGASRGVWRIVAAGALSEADARAALTAAGLAAEQTPRQVREAIDGGFADERAAA
jgi:hypothetical protein